MQFVPASRGSSVALLLAEPAATLRERDLTAVFAKNESDGLHNKERREETTKTKKIKKEKGRKVRQIAQEKARQKKMDEKEVSSGGGSDGNELEDNKKKREKAPKGGVQSLNASPRRGFSPRFGPPPENHHQAKKKKKGKKARDGDGDGDDNIEEGGSRVRDRSKSLDYSAMSEISSRLQEDKKEKKENKKKNNNKGATATREGRSATTLEAPGPSKLNSSKSRSSSVRNALTCFIPSSKESTAMDETMIDKKKMGDMITLAAEAEDDDGGSGKRKKKKAGKSGSTSSSSSSSSSLSLPASPTRAPTVHHHRLSGGMAFGDDQRGRGAAAKKHRRNLSALEDLQYNNVVVVAANNGTAAPMAIPTSSSSPTLDSRPSKVRIPTRLPVSFCECARLRAVSACAVNLLSFVPRVRVPLFAIFVGDCGDRFHFGSRDIPTTPRVSLLSFSFQTTPARAPSPSLFSSLFVLRSSFFLVSTKKLAHRPTHNANNRRTR
jgi:hypothetical protein